MAYLYAINMRSGKISKIIEKYCEVRSRSLCSIWCVIGHDRPGDCWQRLANGIICANFHKLEEHIWGVSACLIGSGKIYIYVKAIYGNY